MDTSNVKNLSIEVKPEIFEYVTENTSYFKEQSTQYCTTKYRVI